MTDANPAMEDTPAVGHRSDRVGGPLWVVLGVAVLVEALRTDRLQVQGVPWFGAPGLVPGLLGIAIAVAGLLLTLRAWRGPLVPAGPAPDWRVLAVSFLLSLGFAGAVLGHGPSFGLAAGVYLFL